MCLAVLPRPVCRWLAVRAGPGCARPSRAWPPGLSLRRALVEPLSFTAPLSRRSARGTARHYYYYYYYYYFYRYYYRALPRDVPHIGAPRA